MRKKLTLRDLFENNRFVQVFSLVAAALCWMLVAMTQSYTTVETIRNVPVKIDAQSSALTSIGLHPIDPGEIYVAVEVEGLRSVVGRLSPEDFAVTVRLTEVTEAATYNLPLTAAAVSPSTDYQIRGFSPSNIRIRFDRIETRVFKVSEQINGLAIAPGYTEKATVVTPDTINIKGPAAELDKISKCLITAELTAPLDRTHAEDYPIVLYDDNGNIIDPEETHLTVERTEARLTIQVLKIASLPLKVDFTNPPRNFPLGELEALTSISQYGVTLAGPEDLIDRTGEIHLGFIDIKGLTPTTSSFPFDVPLPPPEDQFMRLDNVTTVVVDVDISDFEMAAFNVPEPRVINAPPGFYVEPLARSIPNVYFVGPPEIFETMTAGDIVAEIDLSEREIESGSYNLPVKISVPGKGLVWAVGDHSVTVQVTDAQVD